MQHQAQVLVLSESMLRGGTLPIAPSFCPFCIPADRITPIFRCFQSRARRAFQFHPISISFPTLSFHIYYFAMDISVWSFR